MVLKIRVKQLEAGLPIPKYKYDTDAGCDLYSRVDRIIKPGERALIPTGIKLEIPKGYAGFIQPRSGLVVDNGISIINSPGLIDSGYRGEVKVILINHDSCKTFQVKRGSRICQLVIQKVENPIFEAVEELSSTDRGEGGFGSTGET